MKFNVDPPVSEFQRGYSAGLATQDTDLAALRADLERERLRLAACGVVALADTPQSAATAREMHPDYRSGSLEDVIRRVDECIALRAQLAAVTDERDLAAAAVESRTAQRDAARAELAAMTAQRDAAHAEGVRSVQEQTGVIVRAALELLESVEGNEPFAAEKMRAFKRVFGVGDGAIDAARKEPQ